MCTAEMSSKQRLAGKGCLSHWVLLHCSNPGCSNICKVGFGLSDVATRVTDSGKLPPGSKTKVFVAKGFAQTDALSGLPKAGTNNFEDGYITCTVQHSSACVGRRQPHSQLGGRVGQSEVRQQFASDVCLARQA